LIIIFKTNLTETSTTCRSFWERKWIGIQRPKTE